MNDCIFCKIVKKEKKEEIFYEDENLVVVSDIDPRTKLHLLIITKKHYSDFSEMMADDPKLLVHIGEVVEQLVDKFGVSEQPYTWGFHCGGKQSVDHLHANLHSGMGDDELVL